MLQVMAADNHVLLVLPAKDCLGKVLGSYDYVFIRIVLGTLRDIVIADIEPGIEDPMLSFAISPNLEDTVVPATHIQDPGAILT
jgi:hypothetical protein